MPDTPLPGSEVGRLTAEVRQWLLDRRAAVSSGASRINLPSSYTVVVQEGHVRGMVTAFEGQTRSISPFATGMPRYSEPLDGLLKELLDEQAEGLAAQLVMAFGDTIPYSQGIAPALYQPHMLHPDLVSAGSAKPRGTRPKGDFRLWPPLESAFGLLYAAALEYLRSLPSLAVDELAAANDIAGKVVAFAAADDFELITRVLLGWVHLGVTTMQAENIRIRHLTSHELGAQWAKEWASRQAPPLAPRGLPPASGLGGMENETVALEVTSRVSKGSPMNQDPAARRMLLALELLGVTPCGRGAVAVAQPDWIWPGQGFGLQPIALPLVPRGEVPVIAENLFAEAAALVRLLARDEAPRSGAPHKVALQRFGMAMARREHGESVVDYVVALEALLLGDSDRELRHRFALNGAVYLAETVRQRRAVYDQLLELYDARSRLVHGSSRAKPDDLPRLADFAMQVTRRGLLRALRSAAWPTKEDFLATLLGDDSGEPPRASTSLPATPQQPDEPP